MVVKNKMKKTQVMMTEMSPIMKKMDQKKMKIRRMKKQEGDEGMISMCFKKNAKHEWDGNKSMIKAVNSVKKVLKSWLEDNSIVSMMDKNNKKIRIRDEWADNARLIGRENKGRKKVELFIRVKTDLPFNRLKERVWELCQKEELWVFQKFTEMEHVKRIGILAGVCVEHASLA